MNNLFCILLTYDGDDCAGCQGAAGHGDDGELLLQPRHVTLQLVLFSLNGIEFEFES